MQEEFILDALNELIETCQDSEQDFLLCAQQINASDIKQRFLDRAKRAHKDTIELRAHVVEYGVKGQVTGSVSSALKRAWLRLQGAVLRPSEQAWLRACSEAEVRLLKRYRVVMQTSLLPAPVQATLVRHFHAWQHVHHQMRSMHGLLKASM